MNAASNVTIHAFRLKPGEDLKESIELFVKKNNIAAGWIVTCVGSLTRYNIRFADRSQGNAGKGHFEIVSLTGTLSVNGSHMHISLSDEDGRTVGGHLLSGCSVYTTAEIVVQSTPDLEFKREIDGTTSWKELQVVKSKGSDD